MKTHTENNNLTPNDVMRRDSQQTTHEGDGDNADKGIHLPAPKCVNATSDSRERPAKKIIGHLKRCTNANFHGIECMECEEDDSYGFEGCYNNDLNHPDPRPAHQIWIKKLYAEKLWKLFTLKEAERHDRIMKKIKIFIKDNWACCGCGQCKNERKALEEINKIDQEEE